MVLGSSSGVNFCTATSNCASTNVGIGTTAPACVLEVNSPGATVAQMAMVSNGTDAAISVNNTATGGHDYSIDSGTGSTGVGAGNFAIYDHSQATTRLVVNSSGFVGIGTTTPSNVLTVVQGGGLAIANGWINYSSRRWKTNIQTLHGALAKVEHLRGVSYDRKDSGKHELGLIVDGSWGGGARGGQLCPLRL